VSQIGIVLIIIITNTFVLLCYCVIVNIVYKACQLLVLAPIFHVGTPPTTASNIPANNGTSVQGYALDNLPRFKRDVCSWHSSYKAESSLGSLWLKNELQIWDQPSFPRKKMNREERERGCGNLHLKGKKNLL
jgi:hypothetical protein